METKDVLCIMAAIIYAGRPNGHDHGGDPETATPIYDAVNDALEILVDVRHVPDRTVSEWPNGESVSL